jgi:metal-responsive CopG/Arc/MetJ family transcriptional regulator
MKTAISIDETVFREADAATVEMGLSRSGLYTRAIEEYLTNHRSDTITGRLNQYYANHKAVLDDDVRQASYALFAREDW